MTFEAWYTIGTIALVITALVTVRINVDTAMLGGLTLLLLGDQVLPGSILPLDEGIAGFAHPAIIMIGSLYVVAAGLQETGGMELIAQRLLGRPKTIAGAQLRMMAPVAVMSGFMNNTPIVAMYLPIISDWARKLGISPSKLYMPLSFSAILGGKLTLIGTSSNIVVVGLYLAYFQERAAAELSGTAPAWLTGLGVEALSPRERFWGIAALGVPTLIAGMLTIMALSRWLLPERRPATEDILDSRRYQVEMIVEAGSPIVGRTIEEAGLRHLPGLYLTHLERGDLVIPAVSPHKTLEAGDRLAFVGVLDSVVDLRRIRGLVPSTDQVKKISTGIGTRTLVEAVVARGSHLIGRTVRESSFRTKYNAAIIAVHRNGEHIHAKVGDIRLQSGDTLLLDTHSGFVGAYRNSDDFYLVSAVQGSSPIRHERASIALAVLGVLIVMLTLTPIPAPVAALTCACLMVATRCVSGTVARSSVSWQVLIVIGSALGMGAALQETRAADQIAAHILAAMGDVGPRTMLMVIFALAAIFAQLITNAGSAVLMFPITMETAHNLGDGGVSPEPFVFTLMIAAGASFISPVAYQTNLMVYGPGGYRFLDFARLGIPLTVVLAIVCALVVPIVFPFTP